MTQYDEVVEFIKVHPGSTRGMIRKYLPHITHENDILKRILANGGHREKVSVPDKWGNARQAWAYYLD